MYILFFFFNDPATPEIYTLSLHDALPISPREIYGLGTSGSRSAQSRTTGTPCLRSEEHTSELQSRRDLVCRLLLEKKKKIKIGMTTEIELQQSPHDRSYPPTSNHGDGDQS